MVKWHVQVSWYQSLHLNPGEVRYPNGLSCSPVCRLHKLDLAGIGLPSELHFDRFGFDE